MIKILFVILGLISLTLGIIGIVVPGLPTTPFVLLSAALFIKSSNRLHTWLLNHRLFGKIIKQYNSNAQTPLRVKIFSLVAMWLMTSISVLFFVKTLCFRIIILSVAVIGTIVMTWIWFLKRKNLDN